MSPVWTLIKKEIRDNLRDRRSLFFALMYGPFLLPLMMMGPMLYSIDRSTIDFEAPTQIAVEGEAHAPNLLQFLRQHNLDAVEAPKDYRQRLASGDLAVVLSIPGTYAGHFSSGEPAPLVIYYASSEDDSDNRRRQLRAVLEQYSGQMRALRFSSRGIDSRLFEPLAITERDQSDKPRGLLFIAYLVPFLLMFSMLMGGYYLA
ncbi:MAG: ABC transporter permease, partial [Chromatocurvus sp.]